MLNSFKDVAERYASVKPLVSQYHTREDDVRPINSRRRKNERIERVNENKYIVHDALPAKNCNSWSSAFAKYPPITWERLDCTGCTSEFQSGDYITVRGSVTAGYDTSRYNFLREYLPRGLAFDNHSKHGKHFLVTAQGRYYLPRVEHGSLQYAEERPDYKLQFYLTTTSTTTEDITGTTVDYHRAFKLVSFLYDQPKTRVDKVKKAALTQELASFWEWMVSVGFLLHTNDWEYRNQLRQEVLHYKEEHKMHDQGDYGVHFPEKLALQIVKDYNHPLRIHLAHNFLSAYNIKGLETVEDRSRFRAAYNRWCNTMFGLTYKTKVTGE